MSIFDKEPISATRKRLTMTEADALKALELAAERLVKDARWHPFRSKINQLRRPLIALRMARKAGR